MPKSPPIHQTPLYRAKAAYANMERRCDGGNAAAENRSYAGVQLRMSLAEWLEWAVPQYIAFLAEHPDLTPCAARNGDAGHYELGNIRIISTIQNRAEVRTILLVRDDGTKLCGACREVKPAEEFARNRSRPDGLAHECRSCAARRAQFYGHRNRQRGR